MTTLAQYDRARAALAEATRVDQVLPILDEIEHVKLYARQIEDQDLLADAGEFQMRAERRLGIVIKAGKAAGHFREGRPKKLENGSSEEPFPSVTLAEVGVGKKLSARAQQRSSIAEDAFEMMVTQARGRIASGKAKIIEAPLAHGAGRVTGADDLDYSPTPPWATRALFEHVLPALDRPHICSAWEPACGEGHIAEVLLEYLPLVRATDIHDYGYGDGVIDFLDPATRMVPPPDLVITNPPFEDRVLKFMLRALEVASVGVAMFLQLRYLEGVERYNELFKHWPPTLVAPFVERVPLLMGQYDPKASTTTAFMWLVWIHGATPRAPYWIPPGRRNALTKPDDAARFKAHPVIKRAHLPPHDPDTGEVIETEAIPIPGSGVTDDAGDVRSPSLDSQITTSNPPPVPVWDDPSLDLPERLRRVPVSPP